MDYLSLMLKIGCYRLKKCRKKGKNYEKLLLGKRAVVRDWDKGTFGELHQEDFSIIRETELLTHDEHVDNINWLVREKDFFKSKLIHRNEFNSEGRCENTKKITTRFFLRGKKKHGERL